MKALHFSAALFACALSVGSSTMPCCCFGRALAGLFASQKIERCPHCANCQTAPAGDRIGGGSKSCVCKAEAAPSEPGLTVQAPAADVGAAPASSFETVSEFVSVTGIAGDSARPPNFVYLTNNPLLI